MADVAVIGVPHPGDSGTLQRRVLRDPYLGGQ
jgi:hypothetical protein